MSMAKDRSVTVKNPERMHRQIFLLTVFSIAMGFLEAIVVVYLRQLYYPEGFGFPLKEVIWGGLFPEYLREIATLAMLLTVSALAGRTAHERFPFFLFCFGVWDIFYYIGLKVFLNWPPSLFTRDILFLIPIVWVAPVLAPISCAGTMLIISVFMLSYGKKGYPAAFNFSEWALIASGALVIFITFVWDYSKILIEGGFYKRFFELATDRDFQSIVTSYLPSTYNWPLFILGEALIFCALILFVRRMRTMRSVFSENQKFI